MAIPSRAPGPRIPARALAASTRLALRDEQKARELWTLDLRRWLPDGRDDPETVLLKVTVEEAEYWERGRGAALALISAASEPQSVRIKSPPSPRESS